MEYLKRVLGIEVLYENKALEHLPNFISTRYDSQKVSLNGQKTVFLYPKTELEQVETLKKHLERVKKVADARCLHKSLGELHLHGVLAPPCRSFSFTLPH